MASASDGDLNGGLLDTEHPQCVFALQVAHVGLVDDDVERVGDLQGVGLAVARVSGGDSAVSILPVFRGDQCQVLVGPGQLQELVGHLTRFAYVGWPRIREISLLAGWTWGAGAADPGVGTVRFPDFLSVRRASVGEQML